MKHEYLSDIEDILEDARRGRMFILVDDESRENEGDLVIPAAMADAEAVNFMAKHGRGLICLSMTPERIGHLGLGLMTKRNESRHDTAFTVSIEARSGVTTGISAADRAHTIQVAIDPECGPTDITTPGHVFPLVARDGGVLVRAGHTEAAVDIARLAGLTSAGVICEIMNDDGSMARMPDLVKFAQFHGLKIAAIADLIEYRRRTENYVTRTVETDLDSIYGGSFRDVLGDRSGKAELLHSAMRMLGREERGVVVLIREALPTALSDKVRRKAGQKVPQRVQLRDYGIGAQILTDLGVKQMTLMTNSDYDIVGLPGYGLEVVDIRRIPIEKD